MNRDLNQQVFRRFLRIFDEHVEVPIVVENPRVEQLILRLCAAAAAARIDQIGVRVGSLRILVQVLHVRVRRRAVEVEVILLDVFAVVAFAVREPEQPFLEDRVFPIPQRQREAQPLLVVGDACQAVFTPAISARSRLIVREIIPRVSPFAVIFADRAPLPFAEIRAPFLPRNLLFPRLGKSSVFRGHCALRGFQPVEKKDLCSSETLKRVDTFPSL
jgi:hypothetical protein